MIATVSFFPWLLVILDQLLWIILCMLALQIKAVKGPSMLVLSSNALGLLVSIEVLLLKLQKAFALQIFPQGDRWLILTTANRYIDFSSRILFLVAVSWVIVLFIRHKESKSVNCSLEHTG